MSRRYRIYTEFSESGRWSPPGTRFVDEVSFSEDDKRLWMSFEFHDIGNGASTPVLCVHEDNWGHLAALAKEGFVEELAALDSTVLGRNPTILDIAELLEHFGFKRIAPKEDA